MARKLYFAFDFDGTICKDAFPKIGEPKTKIVALMKKIHSKGHVIIIFTCRSGQYLKDMEKYLKEQHIPYNYINKNPEFDTGSPKVYADFYIDDKGVNASDVEELFDKI